MWKWWWREFVKTANNYSYKETGNPPSLLPSLKTTAAEKATAGKKESPAVETAGLLVKALISSYVYYDALA